MRSKFLSLTGAAALAASVAVAGPAMAQNTIKVGILHSLSGTMAISETTLKDVMLMLIPEQNKKGWLLGKKLEPVVVDPASNWPLFAEKARELIQKDKVAAVFGCWTSVSRKSDLVLKSGSIAAALMGDPNASIPTPQPVRYRPMFGALGGALAASCVTFVSKAAADDGIGGRLGLRRAVLPVSGCCSIGKKDMVLNDATPAIEVDPETYAVSADGVHLTCEPAAELALAQRYFLF